MKKDRFLFFRKIYNILYCAIIIFTGICFMAGCLVIYHSGDKPFSRESVGEVFSQISLPVFLFLLMTIISIVWEILSPMAKNKPKVEKDYLHILKKLHSTHNKANATATMQQLQILQKKRIYRYIVLLLQSLIFFGVFLFYVFTYINFDDTSKVGMITAIITSMYGFLPYSILTLGYALYVNLANNKSYEQEIVLLKQLDVLDAPLEETTTSKSDPKQLLLSTRIAVLICSIVFIIIGIANNGIADVLAKAIKICTECIGLG